MDYADESAIASEQHFAASLAAVLRPVFGPSKTECEDCGCPIPAARRRAVPGCTRCVTCQQNFEIDTRETA